MKLVSIITVCYNSEKYIDQTIQSVINQTYDAIEYILIDGRSTDNTLSIIEKYSNQYPQLIRCLSERDTGIYNAMNKGIAMANGELIGIINSDDWYESSAVEHAVRAYTKYGKAVYHGIQRNYIHDEVTGLQSTCANQLTKHMIEHPTCFIPKALYNQMGLFDDTYKYVGDYELMLRFKQKNIPFIMIEEIMANFREGGASHSLNAVKENYKLWLKFGMLTKKEYLYRSVMDWLKSQAGRTRTNG